MGVWSSQLPLPPIIKISIRITRFISNSIFMCSKMSFNKIQYTVMPAGECLENIFYPKLYIIYDSEIIK